MNCTYFSAPHVDKKPAMQNLLDNWMNTQSTPCKVRLSSGARCSAQRDIGGPEFVHFNGRPPMIIFTASYLRSTGDGEIWCSPSLDSFVTVNTHK